MEYVKIVKEHLQTIIDGKSLTSSLAGAFFGAWSAYWLNCRAQDKRTRDSQISFITYAVSALARLIGQLYVIKKEIVIPRVKEAETINKEIIHAVNQGQQPAVKLREQSKFVQTEGMVSPIKSDQADFLAQEDPHIIYLLNSLNGGVLRLNQIVYEGNRYLTHVMESGATPDLNLLSDYTHNFSDQTDETLYFAEKAQQVLITFGKMKFKKKFIIKSAKVTDAWKDLKPPKLETWEEIQWFPKKRSWISKQKDKFFGKENHERD